MPVLLLLLQLLLLQPLLQLLLLLLLLLQPLQQPPLQLLQLGESDEKIKEIKEVIELPIKHPELFESLGITLLKGVIIQSGNDASVALAEHVAGNEDQFADLMNQQAQLLNMNDTQFRNATGLPDEQHYSTAWDLALLTRALIKNHPQQYALYSEKSYTYNNIEQPKLLRPGATVVICRRRLTHGCPGPAIGYKEILNSLLLNPTRTFKLQL